MHTGFGRQCFLLGVGLLAGCQEVAHEVQGDSGLARLFAGFVYVGTPPLGPDDPEHGTASQPLPTTLVVGRGYVFHHRLPVDIGKMALETLPTRLRALGFTILSAPQRDGEGFAHGNQGGIFFGYKVRQGSCEATLGHGFDPALARGRWPWQEREWEAADYVFKALTPCNEMMLTSRLDGQD